MRGGPTVPAPNGPVRCPLVRLAERLHPISQGVELPPEGLELPTQLLGIGAFHPEQATQGVVALVFGREDRGLGNEALDLCHAVAIVPTNPDYSSLNLAQAVLLLSYEVFLAVGGEEGPLPRGKRSTRPATVAELEETYMALEEGLRRIEFFKARAPEAILRTLRTVISRAEPDRQEAGILRSIGFEISAYLRRTVEGKSPGTRGRDGDIDEEEDPPSPEEP